MARFLKKRDESKGLAPGSLVFIGEKKIEEVRVRVMDYNKTTLSEREVKKIPLTGRFRKTRTTSWINVYGLHDAAVIKEIGKTFDLHPLLLEDVMNTGQRPELEEFDNCLFLVLNMHRFDKETQTVVAERLSIVLGDRFLLTFQERPADVFEPVRERIRKHKGRIRSAGPDYLAYALLDTVVDNYFSIIERIGRQVEDLDEDVLGDPLPETLEKINSFRRELNFLRKSVRPAREAILHLTKLDSEFIHKQTVQFLQDLLVL